MDHVLAGQVDDRRPVHRQVQLVDRRDVVLGRLVAAVEPDRVGLLVHQTRIGIAEHTVGAGVPDVPGELLCDDADDHGVALGGEFVDPIGPQRDREADQQDHLGDGDADLRVLARAALGALVVRLRVLTLPETGHCVDEVSTPPDEQDQHQHVDPIDHAIDPRRMSRRTGRKKQVHHGSGNSLLAASMARRRRYTKKVMNAICTTPTRPNSRNTPARAASISGPSASP